MLREFFLYSLSQPGSFFDEDISSMWLELIVDKARFCIVNHNV